jgi:hypothetical protein
MISTHSRSNNLTKPPRTFGISIAILASICLFSCLPLTQSAVLLALPSRNNPEFISPPAGSSDIPSAVGGEIFNFDSNRLIVQGIIALAFLVIAVFAWRGKPSAIRWVLIGAVLLLSVGNFVLIINTLATPPTLDGGLDSGSNLERNLVLTQLCFTIAIPLYVVWYMSRGPARAFYRGHYLQNESRTAPTDAKG